MMSAPHAAEARPTIPREERLIVALDVPSHEQAYDLVESLGDAVHFYKVGFELFLSGDYSKFLKYLSDRNKKIFVDLKFFDIPETVAAAMTQLTEHGATFVSVHGNDAILRAAVGAKGPLKVLAVTVLTSLDNADLIDLGFQCDVQELVLSRARRALQLGCDGIISSGQEAAALRAENGQGFLIVTPGIRPVDNRREDDQKRIASPEQAFRSGADYVVMGRPIRQAEYPRQAAEALQETIASLFPE